MYFYERERGRKGGREGGREREREREFNIDNKGANCEILLMFSDIH